MSEVNSNTYTIMNNPLLQDTDVIEAAAGVIQDVLDTMDSYVPVEVNTFADWAYDAGDIVTIVKDGVDYVMPIFTNVLNWNGGSDVTWQSSGNPEREIPDAPQRQRYGYGTAIQGVETDLDETKKSFHTYMEQTDTYISLIADETDIETAQTLSSTLFKITSASITGLVEKVGAVPTGENLYSLYQQDAGMIALVVGTGFGGNYIKAASIVTAINDQDGSGQVMIDADQITLNGETKITGTVTIDGTDYYGLIVGGIEADGIYCKDLYIPSGQGTGMNVDCEAHFFGNVFFEGDYVFGEDVVMSCESMTTGGLTVTAGEGQGSYSLTPSNVPGMVTDLQLLGPTNNVYTLQKKTVGNNSWANVGTFSRATQLSGVWGSGTGVLTVTATPQGDQYVSTHYLAFDGDGQHSDFSIKMRSQDTGQQSPAERMSMYGYLVLRGSKTNAMVVVGPSDLGLNYIASLPVGSLYSEGYGIGWNDGYGEGESDGYSAGYAEGYADGYADAGGGGGGGTTVNLRSGPGTGYSILKRIPDNTALTSAYNGTNYAYNWMPVTYDGANGYVMAEFLYYTNAWQNKFMGTSLTVNTGARDSEPYTYANASLVDITGDG